MMLGKNRAYSEGLSVTVSANRSSPNEAMPSESRTPAAAKALTRGMALATGILASTSHLRIPCTSIYLRAGVRDRKGWRGAGGRRTNKRKAERVGVGGEPAVCWGHRDTIGDLGDCAWQRRFDASSDPRSTCPMPCTKYVRRTTTPHLPATAPSWMLLRLNPVRLSSIAFACSSGVRCFAFPTIHFTYTDLLRPRYSSSTYPESFLVR